MGSLNVAMDCSNQFKDGEYFVFAVSKGKEHTNHKSLSRFKPRRYIELKAYVSSLSEVEIYFSWFERPIGNRYTEVSHLPIVIPSFLRQLQSPGRTKLYLQRDLDENVTEQIKATVRATIPSRDLSLKLRALPPQKGITIPLLEVADILCHYLARTRHYQMERPSWFPGKEISLS